MKKLLYILAGITLVSAISCTKEESMNVSPDVKGEKITLSVQSHDEADTKLSIGEKDGAKYPLLWTGGDVVAIYSTDVKTTVEEDNDGNFVPVVSGTIKGEQAELVDGFGRHTGTFDTYSDVFVTANTDIVVVYPGNEVIYTDNKVSRTLPATQTQRKENSSEDIGNYTLAYGTSSLAPDQTKDVAFSLSQKTAFVKVTLTTSEFSSLKLSGVKLYSPGATLSGNLTYDLSAGKLTVADATDEVGATLRNPAAFDKAQTLYFTAAPYDLKGKDTYLVVSMIDEANNSTVTIPAKITGGELKESCLTVITLDNLSMESNAAKWYEPVETRYIANFGEGWSYGPQNCYVAYFDGDAVTFDVKARGNFAKCKEPKSVIVYNACEQNINNKDNLYVNGSCCHDGTDYVKFDLDDTYTINVAAKAAGSYTGYSSKLFLKDADGRTIWCFNIWGNKEQLKEQTYVNGVMLDRNIGATQRTEAKYHKDDSTKDYYMFGSYYQWGRPFQTGWSSSGGLFQKKVSNVTDLSVSAASPEYFMQSITGRASGDWYLGAPDVENDRSTRIDDLWGNQNTTGDQIVSTVGTKSIYDPCPKGYMVPSPKVLAEMVGNAKTLHNPTYIFGSNKVWLDDAKTQELTWCEYLIYTLPSGDKAIWQMAGCKWEAGGNCDVNNIDLVSCWSNSTVGSYNQSENRPYLMNYRSKNNGVWPNQFSNRAHGHPVRCMKDVENR